MITRGKSARFAGIAVSFWVEEGARCANPIHRVGLGTSACVIDG